MGEQTPAPRSHRCLRLSASKFLFSLIAFGTLQRAQLDIPKNIRRISLGPCALELVVATTLFTQNKNCKSDGTCFISVCRHMSVHIAQYITYVHLEVYVVMTACVAPVGVRTAGVRGNYRLVEKCGTVHQL